MDIRQGTQFIESGTKKAIIEFVFINYMFGNIIEELLEADIDIFKIIATAGFNGRRG